MASKTLYLTLANLLIPVAILVFAKGFFPYKPFMPGLATYEKLGWEDKMGWSKDPEPQFNKLVFMVVDALRSDFVYGEESGMKFVQSLIRDGSAIPFTAHATSPTITMPRVKAMTTGSIPSFLDVILNFAESDKSSTLATQDTWLAQLRAKEDGKLVFYGDDTWLKLFPGFFGREDGTSSFFVSDFTEVDNNVTRHVPDELLNRDWNAMIMHYLGLDHIGHKTGPRGPNMNSKQIEMDEIVKQIYQAVENEDHLANTLFVLCGDHGMNDGGNHGGSAPGETSPALVFMSPKIKKVTEFRDRTSPTKPTTEFDYYKKIEQSDIAPTLAGLLGFPISRNNLGVFIEDFLYFWDEGTDRVHLLLQNARQIKKIAEAAYSTLDFSDVVQEETADCRKTSSDGERLACKWQAIVQVMSSAAAFHPKTRVEFMYSFLRDSQETMSTAASNYDVPLLYIGIGTAVVSLVLATMATKISSITSTGLFYVSTLVLYGVSMFASSYVEEEHNFWYWATATWFFYLFVFESRKEWFPGWFTFHPALIVLLLHRIIRRWNQTGQKYAGASDIVHSAFLTGFSSFALWCMISATYIEITIRLSRHVARSISIYDEKGPESVSDGSPDGNGLMAMSAIFPLTGTAFMFKLAFTIKDAPELTKGVPELFLQVAMMLDLLWGAWMVFIGLALISMWIIVAERKRSVERKAKHGTGDLAVALFDLITLFLITQTQAKNIPLYLLYRLQLFFISQPSLLNQPVVPLQGIPIPSAFTSNPYPDLLDLSPTAITITTLLLSQATFFAAGNNNAISSIDLSNAYNGVSGYNIVAVGILVFVSNWIGPIYWSSVGVLLLGSHGREKRLINLEEVDRRDWVDEEHRHLIKMERSQREGLKRRQDTSFFRQHVALQTVFVAGGLVAVMTACTALRTHLFIWTVFSPKYLFAMAWALAHHVGVDMALGGLFWYFGTW